MTMTADQNASILAFWKANSGNPQAVMDAMTQYGVSAQDLASATGQSLTDVSSYLRQSGAADGFAGIQGSSSAGTPEPMSQYKDISGNYIPQRVIDLQQSYASGGAEFQRQQAEEAARNARLAEMRASFVPGVTPDFTITQPDGTVNYSNTSSSNYTAPPNPQSTGGDGFSSVAIRADGSSTSSPDYSGTNDELKARWAAMQQKATGLYDAYANSPDYGDMNSASFQAYKAAHEEMNQFDPSKQIITNTYAQTGVDPYAAWDKAMGKPAGSTLAVITGDWSKVAQPAAAVAPDPNGVVVGGGATSPVDPAAYSNHNLPGNPYYNASAALQTPNTTGPLTSVPPVVPRAPQTTTSNVTQPGATYGNTQPGQGPQPAWGQVQPQQAFQTPVLDSLYGRQQQAMTSQAPSFNFQQKPGYKSGGAVMGALTKVIKG